MRLRTAHAARKTPARTGGDDRPAPACDGQWDAFDVLIDHPGETPQHRYALRAAREICATCPLFSACMTADRDRPPPGTDATS